MEQICELQNEQDQEEIFIPDNSRQYLFQPCQYEHETKPEPKIINNQDKVDNHIKDIITVKKPVIEYKDNVIKVPKEIMVEKIFERPVYYEQIVKVPKEYITENIIIKPVEHIIKKKIEIIKEQPEIIIKEIEKVKEIHIKVKKVKEIKQDKIVEIEKLKTVDVKIPKIVENVIHKKVEIVNKIQRKLIRPVRKQKIVEKVVEIDNPIYVEKIIEKEEYYDVIQKNFIEKQVNVPIEVQVTVEKLKEVTNHQVFETVIKEEVDVNFQGSLYNMKNFDDEGNIEDDNKSDEINYSQIYRNSGIFNVNKEYFNSQNKQNQIKGDNQTVKSVANTYIDNSTNKISSNQENIQEIRKMSINDTNKSKYKVQFSDSSKQLTPKQPDITNLLTENKSYQDVYYNSDNFIKNNSNQSFSQNTNIGSPQN